MANSVSFIMLLSLLAFAPLCLCQTEGNLSPNYYNNSCPNVEQIVRSILIRALLLDYRIPASILRLHFHDCFATGCDASLLLDNSESIVSEKESGPNANSARGFDVIDEIKTALERECPQTVSCADILALAAKVSVVIAGGPSWEVLYGRRDSLNASISASNNNIPAPTNTFQTIRTLFQNQGLNLTDLVALSGAHTIGYARCTSFRQRLYNQSGDGTSDPSLDQNYATLLRTRCPRSGGDQNLFPLDFLTPLIFDNRYYKNLLVNKGLLNSDQVLFTMNQESQQIVRLFAQRNDLFFQQFAQSMIKMGNISPLTGSNGEIRRNCRRVNSS
ncbi:hypothetical protein VNO77_02071 [Canavalia gladiata]|uniref:Peroxidase n=1 Tax=Canavalia gladiata TaxID=3824 RepID=A0AAN9R2Q1_CANGL